MYVPHCLTLYSPARGSPSCRTAVRELALRSLGACLRKAAEEGAALIDAFSSSPPSHLHRRCGKAKGLKSIRTGGRHETQRVKQAEKN